MEICNCSYDTENVHKWSTTKLKRYFLGEYTDSIYPIMSRYRPGAETGKCNIISIGKYTRHDRFVPSCRGGENRLLFCVQSRDLCTQIVPDYQEAPLTSIVNIFEYFESFLYF